VTLVPVDMIADGNQGGGVIYIDEAGNVADGQQIVVDSGGQIPMTMTGGMMTMTAGNNMAATNAGPVVDNDMSMMNIGMVQFDQ